MQRFVTCCKFYEMKKIQNILLFAVVMFLVFSCTSAKPIPLFNNDAELNLVSNEFSFTEGPAADSEGNVYFTDQPNDKIYKWNWRDNSIELFSDKTGRANGTYVDKDGNLLTCSDENGEIWKFSTSGNHEILAKNYLGKRLNGPNDLWIDEWGGIYFTDPLYERSYWENFKQEIVEEGLYYRYPNGKIKRLDTFTQPNGIIGSNSEKKLYVSDIDAGKTYVYDISDKGTLSNKKVFCDTGSDGMTLDNRGNLYLTGDGVTIFNKEGKQIEHINIPEKWTANVTFGGKNFSTLFITASNSVYTLEMNVSQGK